MCGIAGVLEMSGTRASPPARIAELGHMIDLIGHRGPDEAGTFIDDRAAMAVARLSINDLEHGQQPMGDPDQRFWIVYNGEIYNHLELRAELGNRGHRFQTRCDTEVALRAWMEWGEEAPAHFEGGYAFVVYDRSERAAFLVRDRFGKRPLFYCTHGDTVVFASEIKALLARADLPLSWDAQGLASIFAKWTPFGVETPFQGVRQVLAGTTVRVSERGLAQHIYVDLTLPLNTKNAPQGFEPSFEEASANVTAQLEKSVRLRLRGDVHVGVLLSGGLDSSVITHLVREYQPSGLRTFSICFEEPQFDESQDQQLLVDAFGLDHSAVKIGAKHIADNFCTALWHAEIPQFRTAFVPMFLLSQHVRTEGVKVVLSGEGADEIFLGYDIFKEARLRAEWNRLNQAQRRQRIRGLYPYLPHFTEANLRVLEANYARSIGAVTDPLFSHASRFANGGFALRLLRTREGALDSLLSALPNFEEQSPVRKAQWIEFHTLLQGYLLSSQGDRMAFAHGVEPRCPFLSSEVVAYAAQLPERYLLSAQDDEKHLIKHAFRANLPLKITSKPKQPYRAPDAAALRAPENSERFYPWVEDLLCEQNLRDIGPLDSEEALRFIAKLRRTPRESISPREDQAFILLLSLVVLDQQFIRRLGVPSPSKRPPLVRTVDLTAEQSSTQKSPWP